MQYITEAHVAMFSIISILMLIVVIMIIIMKEEADAMIEEQKMMETFKELEKTSSLTFPNGVTIPVTEERLKDIWEGMNQPKGNLVDTFIIL